MSVVGFDFGYQNCYIAVARQGGIETIANEYSDRNTPAYVSFGEKNRSLGVSAKNQAVTNVKNTIWGWRKLIGRKWNDPVVEKEKGLFPYEVVEGPNGTVGLKVQYLCESQVFSPEQITAMLLVKLRDTASHALNTKVVDCVINCPCYLKNAERCAMLDAAKMAGLNVLRLMNDTTAIALAYGIYKQDLPGAEEKSRNVVFVDLGHSDIQCAAVAFNKGKLRVLSTSADPCLGGRDLDKMLAEYFVEDFKKRYKVDAHTKPRAYMRLLTECEKLKKLMSANTQPIPVNIECFMEDKDVTGSLDRETMENMAAAYFDRMEDVMMHCLENANLSLDDIYSVEIVGGSSRIPAFKQRVAKVFNKEPSTTLNSDEAVARGCALQCAILSPVFRVRDFSVVDAQPYSITLSWTAGMEDESEMEVFTKLHPIPFSKMLTFFRKEPFTIDAKYTHEPSAPIGQFHIQNVVSQANGENSKVKVKVRVNINGVFVVSSASLVEKLDSEEQKEAPMETDDVEKKEENKQNDSMETNGEEAAPEQQENAENKPEEQKTDNDKQEAPAAAADDKKEKESKKRKVKTIELPVMAQTTQLSQEEVNLLTEKECQMQAQDKLEKERADSKNTVEEYVYDMRDKLYGELEKFITESDKEQLTSLLTATEDWLYGDGEDQNKQVYVDKLAELKKLGNPPVLRQIEANSRPAAFEELGKKLVMVRKALEQYAAGDEKYSHIDKADMEKVEKCLKEKAEWFDKYFQLCQALKPCEDPPVQTHLIRSTRSGLEAVCNPILNKPKPKPKEEPPKDDKKNDAKGDKKPAEGQQTNENEQQPAENNAEEKADMELD